MDAARETGASARQAAAEALGERLMHLSLRRQKSRVQIVKLRIRHRKPGVQGVDLIGKTRGCIIEPKDRVLVSGVKLRGQGRQIRTDRRNIPVTEIRRAADDRRQACQKSHELAECDLHKSSRFNRHMRPRQIANAIRRESAESRAIARERV